MASLTNFMVTGNDTKPATRNQYRRCPPINPVCQRNNQSIGFNIGEYKLGTHYTNQQVRHSYSGDKREN